MKKLALIALILTFSVAASAYTLHWDDYKDAVTPGTITYDYMNVNGSGVDVRVDWINSSNLVANYPTNDINGLGMGSGHWFANDHAGQSVVVISFSEPVPYCKVQFWEIDGVMTSEASLTNYLDKIRIKGWDTPYDVASPPANYIAPSNYDGGSDLLFIENPGDAVADSGLNIINGGAIDDFDSNPENYAWIEFEDAAFRSFAFVFSSTGEDRGAVLGDIVFIPEPATMILLGLGAIWGLKRR